MADVSIRDLRNHGGEVIDRVARGEQLTITRGGRPVAQLRAVPSAGLSTDALVERWARLPAMDPDRLRRDVDDAVDSRL